MVWDGDGDGVGRIGVKCAPHILSCIGVSQITLLCVLYLSIHLIYLCSRCKLRNSKCLCSNILTCRMFRLALQTHRANTKKIYASK